MPLVCELRFDTYYRYEPLTAILKAMAEARPKLMSLTSLGTSYEGRDIWLCTITNSATGSHEHKPAVWVDGNIHATEVSASSACLYLIDWLLSGYGVDPAITEVLDTRAFYVVPRVNPDGPELALGDNPVHLRSSVRPYPYDEEPVEGLRVQDIDGDGRILTMRIGDPRGPWKVSSRDPRLLVRREPGDRDGPFYRLLPEGRMLPGWDGVTLKEAPHKPRLDLNRNFPAFWRSEDEQQGAGPFPASEPEVRALVAFIAERRNICHAVTFHTYSGALLRPYSANSDESFPADDLRLYNLIGKKGEELTGYPAISVYHDFRYHPKEVITGGFDDWMYEHCGAFAWTVEIWSALRQAGVDKGLKVGTARGEYRFIEWHMDHPVEEDLALLRWSDEELKGKGYQPWREYDHPELGPVELGGWDSMYFLRNPPPHLLERELEVFPGWLLWQAQSTPLLGLHSQRLTPLGDGCHRLEVVVENRGWLPTYVTRRAEQRKLCRPLTAEIELPPGADLVSAKPRQQAGQLEGVAYKPVSAVIRPADWSEDRARFEWVVSAPQGGQVKVRAHHDRAGRLDLAISIPTA